MTSDFPIVDRNRLISNASKTLLELAMPSTWHIVEISGTDFGLDILVQLSVDGGIQHAFFIQLKGTESPDLINAGTALSYTLKRRTLNMYASLATEVMLAVAVVVLDETDKLDTSASKIYWQWMSAEIKARQGSSFELDLSQGKTVSVHVPCDHVLHSRLDIGPYLQERVEIVRAGMSLEDILQKTQLLGSAGRQPALARLADFAQHRPQQFSTWIQSEGESVGATLPPSAHEIRTLIRAGNTAQAEAALSKLGPEGFGTTPFLRSTYISLQGKVLVQRRRRPEALRLFEEAYAIDPSDEMLLPLAELRLLQAVDDPIDIEQIRVIRDSLVGVKSNDGLSLRVRVHAALQEFSEAEVCLSRLTGSEQLIPRLVLLSAQHEWHEATATALAAETDGSLSIADLTTVQLIAARSAWCGATENVVAQDKTGELPLSGAVGTQLALARESWTLAVKCLSGLRTLGWAPNVELIAPIVCGVAGVLGHQQDALDILGEAAARRPEYQELQLNLELLAISARKPELALTANLRQPDSIDVLTRRTSLLFELRRFVDCLEMAVSVARSPEAPTKTSPMAIAIGYAVAHRIGHLLEAAELRHFLSSRPEWDEFSFFAEFARLGSVQSGGQEPLEVLRSGIAKHPNSRLLAANLFSNLAVNETTSAAEAVQLAKILRTKALLSVDEAIHLVAAHTTLKNWIEAAAEAEQALERFQTDERLLAMGAVAEEMRGRTGAALSMLEKALAVGTSRISAVHNYMGLALRLGRIDAVRTALDRLLGLVTERTERLELLRLSALVYVQQNRSEDALAAVKGLGQLVDQSDEQEEGIFINVMMAVTLNGQPPDESFQRAFAQRIDAFCSKWPDSKLFRRVGLPDKAITGLDDLHNLLDPLIGDSRARLREFEQRERQARRGEFPVPFVARPGFVLHYIGDPFGLWEVAMRSRPEDLQFHLNIVGQGSEPKSPNAKRNTPLLDLTALLVLDSLDLFDKLFSAFERVAIPRVTVGFVSQHANSVLASGASADRAKSILSRINLWLSRIDQPSAANGSTSAVISAQDTLREYADLAKRCAWLTYCDDAICRAIIHTDDSGVQFCTTIDLLALLDTGGELSESQVAAKLARLAEWHVGIAISDRYLIASLTGAWQDGVRGDASRRADAFRSHEPFATLSRAIWHPGKSANDLVAHMAHLLRSMLQNPKSDADSAAAVLANWFIRVRMLRQTEGLAWRLVCYPVLLALKAMPDEFSGRLLSVLQRAVAASVGEQAMSVGIEGEVAQELGAVAASIANRDIDTGGEVLRKLLLAMPLGTADGDRCMDGYKKQMKESSPER